MNLTFLSIYCTGDGCHLNDVLPKHRTQILFWGKIKVAFRDILRKVPVFFKTKRSRKAKIFFLVQEKKIKLIQKSNSHYKEHYWWLDKFSYESWIWCVETSDFWIMKVILQLKKIIFLRKQTPTQRKLVTASSIYFPMIYKSSRILVYNSPTTGSVRWPRGRRWLLPKPG